MKVNALFHKKFKLFEDVLKDLDGNFEKYIVTISGLKREDKEKILHLLADVKQDDTKQFSEKQICCVKKFYIINEFSDIAEAKETAE